MSGVNHMSDSLPSSSQNSDMNTDIHASHFTFVLLPELISFFWPHLTFQGGIFWFSSLSMTLSIDIKLLEYRYIYLSLFYLIWMLIK